MKFIIIKAPAKVNLYLDVLNKRPDGYHNIETIFERIDLYDWVKITIIPKGIKITCNKNLNTPNKHNTVYKAAEFLIDRYNLNCGFRIDIDKRIPIAAGLGGGSSDAAAVLIGINKLLNLKLSRPAFVSLGDRIGADVPFFVSGYKRAFATGTGERLKALSHAQKLHFLIIYPNIGISTAYIYNNTNVSASLNISPVLRQAQHGSKHGEQGRTKLISRRTNLGLTKKRQNANIARSYLGNLSTFNIKHILFNKLEEVILPSYPALRDVKTALKTTGAEGVLVSGSGSAVFGIYKSRRGVFRAESKLNKKGNWQLFSARSC
ncbi:MAG: 4-(cytidine 5'-diphospho)-2-C-methyl-D-erythritol kinase [Candidatus Omnitrophica bacterium]|nr:4-(cytidine 5'-diphospho)-2-C-methyl-D-erythritol kinase [Candidatus Omnitrophota bacterium]